MTLCGVCAPGPGARQTHATCDGCGLLTECAIVDTTITVIPAPRAAPPASGRHRTRRAA